MNKCAIILAAGQGTRIKSRLPKVLHKVCGKEMVNHVIDTMRAAELDEVNVIIGKGAELVKERTASRNVSYSLQEEQLGTGHAVICTKDFLKGKSGVVAIFTGDAPLIKEATVRSLIETHINEKNFATLLTSVIKVPTGYGRIIRENAEVDRIVEHKDCSVVELEVKEINAGMYCFDIESLLSALDKLSNNNVQGEYYLTDVIGILKSEGKKVGAMITDFEETIGVNSRAELSIVEGILRKRINRKHLDNGVTLIDENSTYIAENVEIGQDTIIYPNTVLEGKTIIGEDCIIYSNSRLSNAVVGNETTIESSVIVNSKIGDNTTVGPFAYVRPDSNIGNHVKIGDFVEIKKSTIGNNTKVSHLTYIGDAQVGESCNFGCGTVVVNYDGKNKNKTIVGDNAFIGCNTNLVSPVKVEDNSYIAAGSTITDTVKEGSLAIARARQTNIEGWVNRKRK
ncbi:bifunctional UDP-N-acetylglucosamine diphosphorylase/glucosamine-1-phosphate N-acetyltransferase GlmU [uncultured Clostridium sp.]|jgi:bifunctional UDP-N-acetylglucosamine pyrophosphorylase/glucosamine-1-phosphate N-acetyltransferase|uniref:bifunctional UDP-N-acetylglucosamine diphosphorylase/glucosamine-1-phosphate N-acetyltransferase GlmU n=1 Tax=uncultured Clostridium sp. TaxID=59620 RepID=UPI0026269433|nr:bifunctional UDP-N-acetylglucosamine diphosphorylase/glucosamine-1-phosphate N-acetyltransferase GlmU [uncultured Clostridium sp.]